MEDRNHGVGWWIGGGRRETMRTCGGSGGGDKNGGRRRQWVPISIWAGGGWDGGAGLPSTLLQKAQRRGGKRHQLGGTWPSWWEIKDGSDTGCQNNNGALTVRCVVLLSVGLLCCVFVSAIFVVSPKPCATVFPPPHPVTSGFLCLCDGDQHATLAWARAGGERSDAQDGRHEHIWSVYLPPPPLPSPSRLRVSCSLEAITMPAAL